MRNISFALTTEQFKNRTKTVTRRLAWAWLQPGTKLMGCEKCMGLKPGDRIQKIHPIRVIEVWQEPLGAILSEPYGSREAVLEGFPGWTGQQFFDFFCRHGNATKATVVTRIRFEHLEPDQPQHQDHEANHQAWRSDPAQNWNAPSI